MQIILVRFIKGAQCDAKKVNEIALMGTHISKNRKAGYWYKKPGEKAVCCVPGCKVTTQEVRDQEQDQQGSEG